MDVKVELKGHRLISPWLGSLAESTRRVYSNFFGRYLDWLRGEGLFLSPEDLLRDFEDLRAREQYRHVDLAKRWVRGIGGTKNTREAAFFAINSFYAYHRFPLPPLTHADRREMFRVTDWDVQRRMADTPITREQLRNLLLEVSQPYRSILLIMFQSGMGQAEFQYFNCKGWGEVVEVLKRSEPIQLNLYRRKVSVQEVRKFYTFISEDGKGAILRWLPQREKLLKRFPAVKRGADKCLFLTYDRPSKCLIAPAPISVWKAMKNAALRLQMRKAGDFNKFKPHNLRDAFRSICTVAGVNRVAAEWFLGHIIDPSQYDKSPELDPEWFRREYMKAEAQLNLFSNPGDQAKVRHLEERLKDFDELKEKVEQLLRKK